MPSRKGLSSTFLGGLSLALLTVTFALCRIRPIYWEDVWWHLGTGQYIATHHQIPTIDIFSWTARGAPWINTEWLYQVALYGFFQTMGLAGVIVLKTILILAALYFLDRRLRHWGASVFERLLYLGLAFLGGWPFWVERADLGSLALLSALFFAIDSGCWQPTGRRACGLLWVLLFAFWSNIHGAYPLGLGVLSLWGTLRLFHQPAAGRQVLAWALACTAATLLNPWGIGLPLGIWKNLSAPLEHVYEWLPPQGLGFSFFFFSLAFSFVSFLLTRKWTVDDFYAALIVLLFAGYALRHERFVHFFMIGAFPYAARQWLGCPWRSRLSTVLAKWEKRALAACALALFTTSLVSARRVRGGVDAASSGYVKEACDFIVSEKIEGPFYNEYKFGSYWIWRFKGNPPAFQDGRYASVLGYDRFIDAALQAQRSPPTWIALTDALGIQAALVRYPSVPRGIGPSVFDRYFPRKSWGLVYWDDLSLLFVRRTPRHASLLGRWEYRAMKPDWTLESYLDQLQRGRLDRVAVRRELERALALNPGCWRARVDLHWLEESVGNRLKA